jgi:FkbM family methyltransferase
MRQLRKIRAMPGEIWRKGLKALALARTARFRRGLRSGVAAAIEHRHLARLKPASVIDIGANRGQFALLARELFPGLPLFSFEPLPRPAAVYRQAMQHEPDVALFEAAIGPARQRATIHISARDDCSSLLPITARQTAIFPGTGEISTGEIELGRLEDFLAPERIVAPALLKIDVQGYELQAIQGCERLLDHVAWIYVECSFRELYGGQALADQVIRHLHELGYGLTGIFNTAYDGDGAPLQADFMFERRRA